MTNTHIDNLSKTLGTDLEGVFTTEITVNFGTFGNRKFFEEGIKDPKLRISRRGWFKTSVKDPNSKRKISGLCYDINGYNCFVIGKKDTFILAGESAATLMVASVKISQSKVDIVGVEI